MRRVVTLVLLLAGAVHAQETRLSPEELHFAAFELLLDDQVQKAAVPLEQAYRARPMQQQPRALVLNHALVDIKQKVNAMRAAKDMRDYLRAGPQDRPDEDAIDLLGAALVVAAARDEKIREN